ncbi:MAG: sulfur carrier protein ThiS [Nevskia sp.]|nr:sulfur carrier protein ThiS [Nevskia sp.]
MQILLNGTPTAIADGSTIASLVEALRLGGQRIAVELNGDIVPRSRWQQVRLAAEDKAEIVKAIGGG